MVWKLLRRVCQQGQEQGARFSGALTDAGRCFLHPVFPRMVGRCCCSRAEGCGGLNHVQAGNRWPSKKQATIVGIRSILHDLGWTPSTVAALRGLQVQLTPYEVVMVLKHSANADLAYNFFRWAREEAGCKHDRYSYTAMIKNLGQARKLDKMKLVMKEMQREGCQLDFIGATTVIWSYAKAGMVEEAAKLFCNLEAYGCQADSVTFTVMINMYTKAGLPHEAVRIFEQMVDSGCVADTRTYNTVIHTLGKMGRLSCMMERWEEMKSKGIPPDKYTYGILMDVHGKSGKAEVCLELYKEMKAAGFFPNKVILETMMKGLEEAGKVEAAEKLFADVDQEGDVFFYSTVIDMWSKTGNVEKAWAWFGRMTLAGGKPTLQMINTLVALYLEKRRVPDAKQLLQLSQNWGVSPSLQTAALVLHSWAECEEHEEEAIKSLLVHAGPGVDELIAMLLDTSCNLSLVNSTVTTFFRHGEGSRHAKQKFADELMNLLYKMGRRQQAASVWDITVWQLFYWHDQVIASSGRIWAVNVETMQAGTALVGLPKILLLFKRWKRSAPLDWVHIHTGSASETRNSLHAAVSTMLASLGSPFSMDSDQGQFVARGRALLGWLQDPQVTDMLTHGYGLTNK